MLTIPRSPQHLGSIGIPRAWQGWMGRFVMQIYARDFSEESNTPFVQPLWSPGLCTHIGTEKRAADPRRGIMC